MNSAQINTIMSCKGGGTDFDEAFKLAAQITEKYIANSLVVFIFMTDGGASYPSKGIAALQKLQKFYPNKLKYAGIQLNCKAQVMKTIATELKGKTGVAYNPDQLTELFKRSVEVIQYREGI